MKGISLLLTIFTVWILSFSIVSAESDDVLKAAFIKDNDLWIKVDNHEQRITNGEFIGFPKWSFDGNWIAYIKGDKENEYSMHQGDLWAYHVKTHRKYKVFSNVSTNFSWSPNQNTLGFQSNDVLTMVNVHVLHKPQQITSGIINFSWLPDGSGFLTSSKAGENVFEDIVLSNILFKDDKRLEPHHFYTIPVGKNDYFYGTSQFKWSHDHRWIAFQLVPTASMSADSNTISVLSNDGRILHKIDEMLNYEEWFQWAPSNNSLAFIRGNNRLSTINKKLTIKDMPKNKISMYTPSGFVDRDFSWISNNKLLVSRSVESDLINVAERPLPSIYLIDLQTGKERKITSPSENEGDFHPQSANNGKSLIWIRTSRDHASVMIANISDRKEKRWIEKIDLGPWYYEHWNWDEVFSLY
ncbi:TolB family protein [Schinkia azotoformans]|uniref:TolB family protein n=1 Tax=Schinkia azotoformans TaxID=1454 RepID=UPI002DB8655B|nr:hypothetical protein [Schinkia azotoformans]MEC1717152.1 hypothetical protein [Schinkia azotoformans]MEC1741966.1 hypothetical protein [Schinkia azotoformans]MEC1747334.1 hypothetical protein [Schinkia azotoformans]MEC1758207.1 hypothetical protein [Schinkia azotoformans]MEC1766392.1 hypothetical protein [Schinkia azotoformans]